MMFKWLYWYATFMFLFFLPGLSIIMAILYGCYAMFSSLLAHPKKPAVAETAPDPFQDAGSEEVASTFDPQAAKRKADAFAEEVRLLELDRHQQKDEQQLNAQNTERRNSAMADASVNQSDSDSWQDRLEAEARA